jgi:hypothetical protein
MRGWQKKALWIAVPCFLFLCFAAIVQSSQTPALILTVLGKDAVGFQGITKEQVVELEGDVRATELKEIREQRGLEVRAALDCSNLPPESRIPGKTCIEGLLYSGESWSPVPEDRAWLVDIWKAAATHYQVPWELLAASAGIRSSFARENCPDLLYGDGPYRFTEAAWSRWGLDAGSTALSPDGRCWISEQPARIGSGVRGVAENLDSDPGGSPYDWVDSTYAEARALADSGAWKTGEWEYNGSPANRCTVDSGDGPVWYPPTPPTQLGPGAALGYNELLKIPRWAPRLAAKYRSNKGKYKPRRDDLALDQQLGDHPMPKEDIVKLLVVAWTAFGARGEELTTNVTKNYAQIGRESGGRPYILQGFIGDVNDTNPAGGLMQFIPGTFDHWKVDGFNDRFNPLDNILATVNAQVNGPYYILDGSSGWSPPFSENPYATGGKAKIVKGYMAGGKVDLEPYRGLPQTDEVSKAVARVAGGASPCYVALVHEWYQAIKAHPPVRPISVQGPGGTKRDNSTGRIVPCPEEIPQDTSNDCMVDNRIIPNLLWIHRKFGIYISDGYSGPLPSGNGSAGCYQSGYQCHSIDGEHPLGLGVDIVPVPGQSWENIDRLAAWAEPEPDNPRPPFRWVGYDGDANHGSGHHLHLSWDHSTPAVPYQVVDWVLVFGGGKKLSNGTRPSLGPPPPKLSDFATGKKKVLRARVSWFDDSVTASGLDASKLPGVALNLRPGTNSGWDNPTTDRWMISARNGDPYYARITIRGRSLVVPILDKGPHESTSRGIDITLQAARKMGWTAQGFPTDAMGKAVILGRKR